MKKGISEKKERNRKAKQQKKDETDQRNESSRVWEKSSS